MEIHGNLVNFKVRANGTLDAFKTLACTEDSQFDITNETAERRTNCGIKTSVAEATFSASGNAVQEIPPAADHLSYNEVKGYQKNRTKLDFTYENLADVPNGIAEGEAVSMTGSGYFTQSTYNASAEADGVGSFSWTFTGTGTLDEFDES